MRQEFVNVVVPTYNERSSLPALVRGVAAALDRPWRLIVVDDGSPDGTADVARALGERFPITVVERAGKLGLGSACREGLRAAAPGAVVLMDADLSHDPAYLPALVAAVDDGADLALGSRYVPGGMVEGWGAYRRLVSGTANLLARRALWLGVRDATTGYRCYGPRAREVLARTECDGYAFQIEVLHLARQRRLDVREVPITFRDRREGESKLGAREIVRFVGTLRRLRAEENRAEARRAASRA